MTRVLDGIRVVDFGQYLAGPLAAMMLGDQGAEVVRIDPPGGPRWRTDANAVLQRGKKSIVLDLKQPGDLEIARRLVAQADVLIENFRPGVMDRLGLGAEAMCAANERLIYCSLPGFAADDPRAALPGWEGVIEAATGAYTPRTGTVGPETTFSAIPLASNFAAFVAVNSITASLIARERCGLGQRVEVPLFSAMFEAIGGQGQKPNPTKDTNPALPLGGTQYRCADGRWIHLFPSILTPRHFEWFAEAFLPKEWAAEGFLDPRRLQDDPELAAELRRRMAPIFEQRPAKEWEQAINAIGVPASVCQTVADWLVDEQAIATRSVVSLDDPALGATRQAGFPVALDRTPPAAPGPRHRLDADHAAVIAELAALEQRPRPAPKPERPLSAALEGYRVVDLTQILAGPTGGRVLADFGAEVIKINNPNGGPIRGHLYVNSGKKTVLLDIGRPEGREVLWKLVEGANAFLQNFRLGVADRLGIGEADVRAHRPDIVYSSVSAYGYEGPRGADRGWESLGQAPTGMQERLGGDGQPGGARYQVCDYGTGMLSAFAVLLGLYHQLRSGEGQHVQASLARTGTYHQIPFMLGYEGKTADEPRGREVKGYAPTDRLFRASDRWFYLAAPLAGDVARLAKVEGLENIDTAGPQLESALVEAFAAGAAEAWVARLNAAGIAAAVALQLEEVMEEDYVKQSGLSILRDHPGIGVVRAPGPAPRLSRTPVRVPAAAPLPGWDAQAVLDAAGLGDRYAELVEEGVIAPELPGGVAAVV
jgi:crotonobetainyl-CoA:carnitine CoA-transferase CaiB-like acyl-CoA transferase